MEATVTSFEEAVGNQFSVFNKRLELQAMKLEKIDSRFGSLEERLGQKFACQDAKFDRKFTKLEKLMQSLSNQAGSDNKQAFRGSSSASPWESTRRLQGVTRLATIDFPRFSGDKFKEWLFQVEQFFENYQTPDDVKVHMASMHMVDVAAQWHQSVQDSDYGFAVMKSWKAYKELLIKRFEDFREDSMAEQTKLQETDEQYDAVDEMIHSVQRWRTKMKAMFKSWREEDLIEKQKKKDELSPMERYFAAKQSIMAKDSSMMLPDPEQNTLLDNKPTTEIVAPAVHDPVSATDPLGLVAVAIEGSSDMPLPYMVIDDDSSLDSGTEVIQHQSTTDLTMDSSSSELVQEPLLLAESALATISIMVKDSMVFQVSNSNLEPCLEVHTVAVGVGDVRQMEFGLDDAFHRIFGSLQTLPAEAGLNFFLGQSMNHSKQLKVSKTWMFKYKVTTAKRRYPSIQSLCLADTSPGFMAANCDQVLVHFALTDIGFSNGNNISNTVPEHSSCGTSDFTIQFMELLPHYGTILKLNLLQHKDFKRLFPSETIDNMLAVILSRCAVTSFPLVCAFIDWFFTTLPTPSVHRHVVIRVIQVWDPGGADAHLLGTKQREFYTFSWSEILSPEAFST